MRPKLVILRRARMERFVSAASEPAALPEATPAPTSSGATRGLDGGAPADHTANESAAAAALRAGRREWIGLADPAVGRADLPSVALSVAGVLALVDGLNQIAADGVGMLGGAVVAASQLPEQVWAAQLEAARAGFVEALVLGAAVSGVASLGVAVLTLLLLRNVGPGGGGGREFRPQGRGRGGQIGRASCREAVVASVVGATVKSATQTLTVS